MINILDVLLVSPPFVLEEAEAIVNVGAFRIPSSHGSPSRIDDSHGSAARIKDALGSPARIGQ